MSIDVNGIILKLSEDKELLKQFLEMVDELNKKDSAPAENKSARVISVYCVPRHTTDGEVYYHPLVVPKVAMVSDNPDDYEMLADADVISLQEKAAGMISMYRMVYHCDPIIVTCSEESYEKLCTMLHDLISRIFGEVDTFAERIGTMVSGFDKVSVLTQVMSQMTVSGASLTRSMEVCSEQHSYVEDDAPHYDEECDEDYDEEDYDDDEDYEDEEDDSYSTECPRCGEEVFFGEDNMERGFVTCPYCGEHIELDCE